MFKKDDKVKVIKGIKAFEGLTGTVLDTNGSQVKVKLNLSEDAEVQKNIINIFEDYQLELESLDLLKEEAEATFDDEEDDEDRPEPTEEAKKELAKYKQMVQDAVKSRKPVKCGSFEVYFKDMDSYNPEIEYEGTVWYENGYKQNWDTPEWDCYDDTTYSMEIDFEELIDITWRHTSSWTGPLDCLKEANIYEDPWTEDEFKPEEILYVLNHLDDEAYDRLDKKLQEVYDEDHERDYYDYYDESLDSSKEKVQEEYDEEKGINELIQDSIKNKKPVKIDPFSLEFKDINDSNPEMEYSTKVIEKGTIVEDELGNPQWATQPDLSYWFPFTFKDFINNTKGIINIYNYIEEKDDHKDSIYNLKPEEIVSIIQRLVKDSNQAKKVYDYLDEAAQKDCDEEFGSFPTEEAKEELLEFERDVRKAVKNGKWVKCGPFEVHFKGRYDCNPDLKYFKDEDFTFSIKMDFEELINIAWRYDNPYDCLKEANIYDDPEEANLNPREILYLLNHLSDGAYERLDEIAQQKYDDSYDRDWEPYYESLNSLKEDVEVAFDNDENEKQVCCICGKEYTGYGNNAEPYKKGRCCDECNRKFVIPSRLNKLRNSKNESLTEQEKKFLDKDKAMYIIDYLMQNHLLDTIDKEELDDILYNRNNEVAFNHKLIELGIKKDFDKEYNKPVDESLKLTESDNEKYVIIKPFTGNYYNAKNGIYVADLNKATTYDSREEALRVADSLRTRHESSRRRINSQGGNDTGKLYLRVVKRKFNDKNTTNESLKLTEEELKAWCSDNDANYYTQDIKDDKVIIRGLNEDLGEYDFKTKELKVFDYSGTTTQEQDLEDDYDDNYIRDYVYDVDMLDDKEYPSWEFVSVIATAENISDDSVIEEAHNRGFKVFIIQASNYEKVVVAAEKITEEDIMEDFASYLEGNPKVTEIV